MGPKTAESGAQAALERLEKSKNDWQKDRAAGENSKSGMGGAMKTLWVALFVLCVLSGTTGCFLGHPLAGISGSGTCDSPASKAAGNSCADDSAATTQAAAAIVLSTPSGPATITVTLTGTSFTPDANLPPIAISNGQSFIYSQLPTGSPSTENGGLGDSFTFTIGNTGPGPLTLTGSPMVAKSGANPGSYNVTQPSATSVPGNGSTTYTVSWTASPASFIMTIPSNSTVNSSFVFTIATCNFC